MSTQASVVDANLLLAEMARLKAENEKLRANQPKPRALSCKVSEKGALSVYGMGRFPVTLYREQWEKLIGYIPSLTEFIKANQDKLTTKGVD